MALALTEKSSGPSELGSGEERCFLVQEGGCSGVASAVPEIAVVRLLRPRLGPVLKAQS